jgi:hypothetical protein
LALLLSITLSVDNLNSCSVILEKTETFDKQSKQPTLQ